MIVQACGSSENHTTTTGAVTMIVSATGTAYVRKGKIKAITRFFRKMVAPVRSYISKIVKTITTCKMLTTKSGRATSIEPPAVDTLDTTTKGP